MPYQKAYLGKQSMLLRKIKNNYKKENFNGLEKHQTTREDIAFLSHVSWRTSLDIKEYLHLYINSLS